MNLYIHYKTVHTVNNVKVPIIVESALYPEIPAVHRIMCYAQWPLSSIALQILTTCPTQEFVGQSHDQDQMFPSGQTSPRQNKSPCSPSTCVCMCAVNAGGCDIDLLFHGWASTSSFMCLVTGNNANTDSSHVSTSPL